MLEIRPIAIDDKGVAWGGNMRLRALRHLKYEKVPVVHIPKGWTDVQKKRFVVKDNVDLGTWNFDLLLDEYDLKQLIDWGLDGDALSKVGDLEDSGDFEDARHVLEVVPPEAPVLKERIQVRIGSIEDYEKIKTALSKEKDIVKLLKSVLKI